MLPDQGLLTPWLLPLLLLQVRLWDCHFLTLRAFFLPGGGSLPAVPEPYSSCLFGLPPCFRQVRAWVSGIAWALLLFSPGSSLGPAPGLLLEVALGVALGCVLTSFFVCALCLPVTQVDAWHSGAQAPMLRPCLCLPCTPDLAALSPPRGRTVCLRSLTCSFGLHMSSLTLCAAYSSGEKQKAAFCTDSVFFACLNL